MANGDAAKTSTVSAASRWRRGESLRRGPGGAGSPRRRPANQANGSVATDKSPGSARTAKSPDPKSDIQPCNSTQYAGGAPSWRSASFSSERGSLAMLTVSASSSQRSERVRNRSATPATTTSAATASNQRGKADSESPGGVSAGASRRASATTPVDSSMAAKLTPHFSAAGVHRTARGGGVRARSADAESGQ